MKKRFTYTEVKNGVEFNRTHSLQRKTDVLYYGIWRGLGYYEILSSDSHGKNEIEADNYFAEIGFEILLKFRVKN
jgi:hypothetical protein